MYHNYTAERLEKKAIEILSKYNKSLITEPQEMDVYHFAECFLDLTTDYKNISNDKSLLGLTCFNDGLLEVWDDDRKNPYFIDVVKGTIIIDNDVLENHVVGRERFTVIHECSHQILHPRFYYKASSEKSPVVKCAMRDIEGTYKPYSDEQIREWQANRLGAALIMPAEATKNLISVIIKKSYEDLELPISLSSSSIHEMALVFNVSDFAMRIRLNELGITC